jgi:hypothetical protein
MKIRELIDCLHTMDPEQEAFVALFKRDGTGQAFAIEEVSNTDGEAQLEIYEADDSARPARTRASGEDLPQAAAIVADQELPDRAHPDAVQGDLRADAPSTARPAGGPREPGGAEARREDPPVVPETTPGTTKPPYEEIA